MLRLHIKARQGIRKPVMGRHIRQTVIHKADIPNLVTLNRTALRSREDMDRGSLIPKAMSTRMIPNKELRASASYKAT
jgi:hypothetical protein